MRIGSSGKRSIVFLSVEKVLQIASIAIVNVVLLRALGPDKFGFLSSATAVLAIALPLATFGQISVIRYMASGKYSLTQLSRYSLLLSAGSSILATGALIVLAFSPLFDEEPTHHLLLILAIAVLSRPLSAFDAYFQASGQNGTAATARLASLVLPTFLRITIAFTSQSLEQLAWVIVLENVTAGIFLAIAYFVRRRKRSVLLPTFPVPYSEIFWQSVPLLVSGLAVILYMRVSQPLLLLLADSAEVSYFSAATNLADALSFIPTILLSALLPSLVKLHADSLTSFAGRLKVVLEFTAALGTLIALGGVLCGPLVVSVLYGPQYAESGRVVQILFLACPFIFLGVMRNVWVVTEGLQRETLISSGIAVSVNIIANLALIPQYGAIGAAIAALLAHIVNGFLAFIFFRRTRPIFRQALRALLPWNSMPTLLRISRSRSLM